MPAPDVAVTWNEGHRVLLAVRPEKISVAPAAAGLADQHCRATVREVIYLGVEHRLIVELTDGEIVRVRSRDVNERLFRPGAKVDLSWDPADSVVLPTTDSGSRRSTEGTAA
jgi:ABC-type Fe3+/spermidine/putrescine transport system ATPase subunit